MKLLVATILTLSFSTAVFACEKSLVAGEKQFVSAKTDNLCEYENGVCNPRHTADARNYIKATQDESTDK